MENFVLRGIATLSVLLILWGCNGNQKAKDKQTQKPDQHDKSTDKTAGKKTTHAGLEEGKQVYRKHCLACHQSDGSGVPGLYPPLRNTEWVNGDKERLISIVVHGLQGEIKVNGEAYDNVMPANPNLSDKEIADVLSYIRANFENDAGLVLPDEVKMIRQQPAQQVARP